MPDPVLPDSTTADASAEAALLAAVAGIVDGLRSVHANAVAAYRPEVDDIILTRSRDVDRIEHTLDGLLSCCGDDQALALFKRLCRYYWDIDPEATARQVLAYREWFGCECPSTVGNGGHRRSMFHVSGGRSRAARVAWSRAHDYR